jgi:hypothetical protein
MHGYLKITSQELSALMGLPYLQQVTYLLGIRPYMDATTSLVGIKRTSVRSFVALSNHWHLFLKQFKSGDFQGLYSIGGQSSY